MKRRRSFWGGIRVVKMNDGIDVIFKLMSKYHISIVPYQNKV